VIENAIDARMLGADCRTYTEVTRERRADGRIAGVAIRDRSPAVVDRHRARVLAAGACGRTR
jgi:glycerol-3-phosphate dehydrogenase